MTDTSEPQSTGDDPGKLRERGDKALEQAQAAEARAADLERQLALADAGIPKDGPGAWFRQAYDGDLATEAIQSAWEAGGGGSVVSADAGQVAVAQPTAEEAAVLHSVAESASFAEPIVNPSDAQAQDRISQMRQAQSIDELKDLLHGWGLVKESDTTMEDFLGRLPDDLRPPGVT